MTGAEHPCLNPWGHQITIEQSTTPAGWYTDPAGSSSKRWWDGVQWTAHLQAATPPAPAAVIPQPVAPVAGTAMAMHQPQPIEPQRVDPYAQANPYGLPAVQERPYTPMQRGGQVSPSYYSPAQQGPGPAIGFLILGSVALALALVGFIPGAPVFYYAGGGIFGVIGGVRTLIRSRGTRSPIASIAAIVLGSLAIILMVVSIAVHATEYASPGFTDNSQSNSGAATGAGTGASASGAPVMPSTPTFASDSNLTEYESKAALISQQVYLAYGGHTAAQSPSYPSALTVDANGSISFPNGGVTLASNEAFKYQRSADGQQFDVFVTGGNNQEVAIYDSRSNKFTWVCDTGASASCPTGGLSPDSGSGAGSNS